MKYSLRSHIKCKVSVGKICRNWVTGPSLDLISVRFLEAVGFNFDQKFDHFL